MGRLAPESAPGRPGTGGELAPAHASRRSPAGYEPEKLDGSIKRYLDVCEAVIRQAEGLGTQVKTYLERLTNAPASPDAMDDAGKATVLFERMTKAGLNLVKAVDELSRLRSFLAGGPDTRPDLSAMGEIELRELVKTAAKALGWALVKADAAIEIERRETADLESSCS